MAQYDFSTLSSSDLEDLVCDLLNADLPSSSTVRYKTFKDGKDQGIDILYSIEDNKHEHVGQVKHFYRTGFAPMLSKLKSEELAKVIKLNPTKYIFATSVDLSVHNAKEICDLFDPYIKSLNDIYGKKDLNRLIESHEDVLEVHYKLWFSDASVLTKILTSDLQFRSVDFIEGELTKKIRLYVRTELFDAAMESLEKKNFIVITGDPGVGKTSLAEMLVYKYLTEDYQLLYIHDDIKEIERVLKPDDSKQIFYFDDFLGSNSAEINKAQGSESALMGIVNRIKRMNNKKLIFTTRNIILTTVKNESEKFTQFSKNLNELVFDLKDYSYELKSKMLINHIDESEMREDLKIVALQKYLFDFIVKHRNFNPRSIEFITTNENINMYDADGYEKYIVENFENPEKIWRYSYEKQIDIIDRWLLNTLLTFNEKVDITVLENAFDKRVQLCTTTHTALPPNPFRTAIEKLDRGFIIRRDRWIDFVNPSLKDFLKNYLITDGREIGLMLNSIRFAQQFLGLFDLLRSQKIVLTEEQKIDMLQNYKDYTRPGHKDDDLIRMATVINVLIMDRAKDVSLVEIINDINDWEALYRNYELNIAFKEFINATKNNYKVYQALIERTEEIVNDLFTGENDLERGIELLEELTETFNINYTDFNSSSIESHLDSLFSEYIFNEVENLKDWATETSEVEDLRSKIQNWNEKIRDLGLAYDVDTSELDCDWDEITRENLFNRMMEKND
ncbi:MULTISPECIES: hypothetical protein [Chryseobacterium]|nr:MULTISPECIES: hypothetical protein [Chryseobacterium]MBF6643864.1 hypothetical protein [Chryseobacterium indologenes]QQQ72409.1 hypothetical protein JHW31_06695 [Chryseobacterium indologenes]